MCVIIHKPRGVALEDKYLREAEKANRHGFGMMWYDPKEDKIKTWKHTQYDINKICEVVANMKDLEVCIHFRIKTHGTQKPENCHPFQVLNKEDNDVDLWFMHNGIITNLATTQNDETDTMAFNRNYLRPVLRHKPSLIKSKAFREGIGKIIGGSKLAFMFGKGEVLLVNKENGVERDGLWFSNQSAFPYVYTHTTNYGHSHNSRRSNLENSKIMGVECEVGDKVWIWNQEDDSYLGEGKIKEMFFATAIVDCLDLKGDKVQMSFSASDGEAWLAGKRYYMVPERYQEFIEKKQRSYASMSVKEVRKIQEEMKNKTTTETQDTNTEEDESEDPLAGTATTTAANDDPVVSLDEARKAKEKAEEEEAKKKSSPELGSDSEKEDEVSKDSTILEYKGIKIDTTMSYGVDNYSDVYDTYGHKEDSVSVVDIYNMSSQQRLEFFIDCPQQSFSMFQDLVDNAVYMDNLEDIADEDAELADEEVERKINELKNA